MKPNLSGCFIVILCLSLNSCKQLVLKFAGIRTPKVESQQTVQKFLTRIGQDTSYTFTLDSALFMEMQHSAFKPGWDSGFRPFQIRVYDRSGQPVMQWAPCEGTLKELTPFDSVPPKNINGLNTELTLTDDLGRYYLLTGLKARINIPADHDYVIIVLFAKWYAGLTRQIFHQVDHYVKAHPELKIMVYKICVDFMDFWGTEPVITLY
jgi:hypothetical protein